MHSIIIRTYCSRLQAPSARVVADAPHPTTVPWFIPISVGHHHMLSACHTPGSQRLCHRASRAVRSKRASSPLSQRRRVRSFVIQWTCAVTRWSKSGSSAMHTLLCSLLTSRAMRRRGFVRCVKHSIGRTRCAESGSAGATILLFTPPTAASRGQRPP